MAQNSGRSGTDTATFDTLVQEEQTLKDKMQARLEEILPAVAEADKIKSWLAEHAGQQVESNNGSTSAPTQTTASRPRTRRGGRREQFLTIVRQNPDGITVSDVAKQLGSPPAYFYKIAGDLKEQGMIADAPSGRGVVAA